MTDMFQEPEDATPLEGEEKQGLLQAWIVTRAELNKAEQDNMEEALAWAFRARVVDLVSTRFANRLHKRMLGRVWSWAGSFRTTERNIGIPPFLIGAHVAELFDEVSYWMDHHTYPPDEIAVRLHYRLVAIHPYANGNGRHARLMADLLAKQLGRPGFSWGADSVGLDIATVRHAYVGSLRAADSGDIKRLLEFARS